MVPVRNEVMDAAVRPPVEVEESAPPVHPLLLVPPPPPFASEEEEEALPPPAATVHVSPVTETSLKERPVLVSINSNCRNSSADSAAASWARAPGW
jgi:hypothetical protein